MKERDLRRNKIGDRLVSRHEELEVRNIWNKGLDRRIESWLRAEVDRNEGRAERELRRAFQLLSVPSPTLNLADATLAQLGLTSRARPAGAPDLAFRLLVAIALGAAGLALATVPRVIGPLLSSMRLSSLVDLWTAMAVGVSQRYAGGLIVWNVLRDVSETVSAALASPVSLAALAAAVLVSFICLRALSELVSFERSAGNV